VTLRRPSLYHWLKVFLGRANSFQRLRQASLQRFGVRFGTNGAGKPFLLDCVQTLERRLQFPSERYQILEMFDDEWIARSSKARDIRWIASRTSGAAARKENRAAVKTNRPTSPRDVIGASTKSDVAMACPRQRETQAWSSAMNGRVAADDRAQQADLGQFLVGHVRLGQYGYEQVLRFEFHNPGSFLFYVLAEAPFSRTAN